MHFVEPTDDLHVLLRHHAKYPDDRQDPEYSGTSASAYCACRA
jgi:hypothetical protein